MTDWLIVDTPNLCWRAYYSYGAKEPLVSVILAVKDVQDIARELDCAHVAWAFDRPPYKRRELFPTYKLKPENVTEDDDPKDELRRQVTKLRTDYLPGLGYTNILSSNGYEADDVIAQCCALDNHTERRFILCSGDQDLYQLLSRRVAVYQPIGKQFLTAKWFRAEYGIPPSLWPDVKAIGGCVSDQIPGVDGVKEKTAIKYLTGKMNRLNVTHQNIANFIGSDDHARNLKLVTLPFEGCRTLALREDDPVSWVALARKLECDNLIDATKREMIGDVCK